MIRVERPVTPPDYFAGDAYGEMWDALKAFYSDYGAQKTKRQSEFSWSRLTRMYRVIRPDLERVFFSKCAYCESRVGITASADVEHFRPKRGARGFGPGGQAGDKSDSTYHDAHYWWLAMSWDNLLLACAYCNRFKATWFPVSKERNRAQPMVTGADLEAEKPLLLNPCLDDPDLHLRYREDGTIEPLTERGGVTIEIIKLNRDDLRFARARELERALTSDHP